jgi:hypothetical protein
MRKLLLLFNFVAVLVLTLVSLYIPSAHAAFNHNDLIDDSIYNNASAMSAGQIDNWLNGNFGSTSCISTAHGFSAPDPTGYSPGGGFTYSGNVSAGRVIADAAQAYGINPEVILTTLQKEQSLVSGGAGCSVLGDSGAMGYGCPDSGTTHNYPAEGALAAPLFYLNNVPITGVNGTCVNTAAKVGFSQQVIHGAWLLKFGQQRSEGNTGWDVQLTNFPQVGDSWNNSDDPQTCYGGPMTQGSFKRCSTDANPVFYDGFTTIDGTSVHMDDGATAALYWYTPHFSGNQHFYNLFSGWFGNPNSSCGGTANVTGVPSGSKVMAYQYTAGGPTRMALTEMNNTGSTCTEAHIWDSGYQSWFTHVATAMRSSDPAGGTLITNTKTARVPAGITGLTYVAYSGGGGTVEVHKFTPDLQTFPGYYDVATNLGGVTPTSGEFVSGDFFGRGYDQLAYVLYAGGSGRVEIHMFDPSLRTAVGYYDVATNLGSTAAANGTFVAGDFLGRGYDQLAYIIYSGGNGRAEVHLFDPSLRTAIGYYDVATNLGGVTPTSGTFVAGDFLGRGYSQLAYVLYSGGGGRVEVHLFNRSLTSAIGFQDIPTNLPSFDPTQ